MKAMERLFDKNYSELVQEELTDNNPLTPLTDYKLQKYFANLRKQKQQKKE